MNSFAPDKIGRTNRRCTSQLNAGRQLNRIIPAARLVWPAVALTKPEPVISSKCQNTTHISD